MVRERRDTYPYLRDQRTLAEIRKHKLIESQKAGEEISFTTAALDWIKKYGQKWKELHAEESVELMPSLLNAKKMIS